MRSHIKGRLTWTEYQSDFGIKHGCGGEEDKEKNIVEPPMGRSLIPASSQGWTQYESSINPFA